MCVCVFKTEAYFFLHQVQMCHSGYCDFYIHLKHTHFGIPRVSWMSTSGLVGSNILRTIASWPLQAYMQVLGLGRSSALLLLLHQYHLQNFGLDGGLSFQVYIKTELGRVLRSSTRIPEFRRSFVSCWRSFQVAGWTLQWMGQDPLGCWTQFFLALHDIISWHRRLFVPPPPLWYQWM